MKIKWLSRVALIVVVVIIQRCAGQTYNDMCMQHRECVYYQFCSGVEFACCSPAYDDPTNSLYCWCCLQDCHYVDGNFCRNASQRDDSGVNATLSGTSTGTIAAYRRRKIPHPQSSSKNAVKKYHDNHEDYVSNITL